MTLMVIIVIMAALYSTIEDLIFSPKPEVSISTKYFEKHPKVNLYDEELGLGLAVVDQIKGTLQLEQVARITTIKAYIELTTIDLETGAPNLERALEIPYKPCGQVKDQRLIKHFFKDERIKQISMIYGICPELTGIAEKYFIESKTLDPPMYSLSVYLYPCSLPNRQDCASIQDISRTQIYFTSMKKAFDPNNHTHPISTVPEFDGVLRLDPRSTKIMANLVK